MTAPDLPGEVVRLIQERIDSVEQLEVLLALRGAPDRWWSAQSVADELRTSPPSAARRLEDLASRGLI